MSKKISSPRKKTSTKKTVRKKTAKKTVAKKATKKTTKRAVVKKSASEERVLVCADDTECFWTTDGQILRDLQELKDALANMSEAVFAHHVTKEKNDFAAWVEHVLQDGDCAAELQKTRKPHTATRLVAAHLRYYIQ